MPATVSPAENLVGEGDAAVLPDSLDGSQNILSYGKTVARMRDAGNGDCINGQKGDHAAADVHKAAKGLHVCNSSAYDVAGTQLINIQPPAFLLHLSAG